MKLKQTSGGSHIALYLSSVAYGILYHIKSIELVFKSQGTYAGVEPYYLTVIKRGELFGFPVLGVDNFSPSLEPRVGQNVLPLGESIYSLLLFLLNIDLDILYFVLSIIFTSLIFLVISRIVMCGGVPTHLSILSSCLIVLLTFRGDYSLQRPISPQFNYLVWLFGLLLLFRLFLAIQPLAPVAFFCGVALYISSPYQASHLALCFLATIFFLWFKKMVSFRQLLIPFSIFFVMALPQWLDVIQKFSNDSWSDYLLRMGIIRSHLPSTAETVLYSLSALILLFLVRTKYNLFIPCLFYTLILVAVSNSNVLTGRTLQTYHFEEMGKFFFALSLVMFFSHVIRPMVREFFSYIIRIPVRFTLVLLGLLIVIQVSQLESKSRPIPTEGIVFEVNETLSGLPRASRVLIQPFDTFYYEALHDINFVYAQSTTGFPIPTRELAERYYLANLCTTLSKEELLRKEYSIFVYALLGGSQKNKAWRQHLSRFGLEYLIAEPRKDFGYLNRFQRYYQNASDFGCINLLDKYQVEYMILEKSPQHIGWVKYLQSQIDVRLVSSSSVLEVYRIQGVNSRSEKMSLF